MGSGYGAGQLSLLVNNATSDQFTRTKFTLLYWLIEFTANYIMATVRADCVMKPKRLHLISVHLSGSRHLLIPLLCPMVLYEFPRINLDSELTTIKHRCSLPLSQLLRSIRLRIVYFYGNPLNDTRKWTFNLTKGVYGIGLCVVSHSCLFRYIHCFKNNVAHAISNRIQPFLVVAREMPSVIMFHFDDECEYLVLLSPVSKINQDQQLMKYTLIHIMQSIDLV